jgi:cellulose synthase/poly-beta-1,6-N-acetylglucosamine synthase-like glycosyltransferase
VISQLLAGVGIVVVTAGLLLRFEEAARRGERESELAVGTGTALEGRRGHSPLVGPEFPAETTAEHGWVSRLDLSINLLRRSHPGLVADTTLSTRQKEILVGTVGLIAFFLDLSVHLTVMVLVGAVILLYITSLLVRLKIFRLGLNDGGVVRISDQAARDFPADQLPTYTVLVPAYGEPEVFAQLVANLRELDYPKDKLEIMLLLEADDEETIAAAHDAVGNSLDFMVVHIPPAEPRTKPKALNYGLLRARGDLVAIFDAEDRPDVLQLRKAAITLLSAPPDVACVQAKLGFFNPHQNLLTKWFTLDYRMWFSELLPGLAQLQAPIPLGGTSNHFRRSVLMEAGGWDPFNVTEDADLGIRLYRLGYRTGVVDSVTLEEANSDFVNWVKQRSRWYKGYAQTLLVHLRDPRALRRDVGLRGMLLACLFIGGTPLLAAMNSFFWTCVLVWFLFQPHFFLEVLPTLTYFLGMISWIGGNLIMLYTWLLTARRSDDKLVLAAILSPLYWIMMAAAATKAVLQLVTAPSFWEKTSHGLDHPEVSEPVEAAA